MSTARRLFLWLIPLILVSSVATLWWPTIGNSQKPLETETDIINSYGIDNSATCRNHAYKTHVLSEDPLVIYIESFISEDEASRLVILRWETAIPKQTSSVSSDFRELANLRIHILVKASSNLHSFIRMMGGLWMSTQATGHRSPHPLTITRLLAALKIVHAHFPAMTRRGPSSPWLCSAME